MAKKKEMTPEEKLAEALVPVEEQPYEVPDNWCWVRVCDISTVMMGQSPKGSDTTDNPQYTPLIGGASEMGLLFPIKKKFTKVITKLCKKDDLIICIRATLGRPVYADDEYCLGRGVAGIRPHNTTKEFLRYFFLTFERYLYDYATGSTFLQVTSKVLDSMPIPLPPLPEQTRIVNRIESLFAKLDEAKEKIQHVLDGAELRKSAILHKAFTGKLTRKWRQENGIADDSWEEKSLGKCGKWHGGGTPSKSHPEYWQDGDLLWITSKDMKYKLIEDTQLHINKAGVENSSANYIEDDAILFVMRSGILRHTFPVATVKKPFTINQDLKALVPNGETDLDYLFYACRCYENTILTGCMKNGTTVESISTEKLMDFALPMPEKREQQEIVRILDSFIAKEKAALTAAEQALTSIDLMKKSILARAFRGQLGTNDPTEESSVELLKEILARN